MEKKPRQVLKINCIPLKTDERIYESTQSISSSQSPDIFLGKKETIKSSIKNFFKQKFGAYSEHRPGEKSLHQAENQANTEVIAKISEIINSPNFDLIKQFLAIGIGPVGDCGTVQSFEQHLNRSIEAHIQRYLNKRQLNRNILKHRKKFRISAKWPVQNVGEQAPFRVSDRIERFENLNNSINSNHSQVKDVGEEFKVWSPKVIDYICKKNKKVKINKRTSILSHSKSNTANPSNSSYHSANKSEVTMNAGSLNSVVEVKKKQDDLTSLEEFHSKIKSDHIELMSHEEILEEKLIMDRLLFKMDWNLNFGKDYDAMKKRHHLLKLCLSGIKCSNCAHSNYFH